MYENCTNVKKRKDGIDFYYLNKNNVHKMIKFLEYSIGTKLLVSNRLITEDKNNNKMKYKFSYSVEIISLCKDDLVILDEEFAKKRSISRMVLVTRVTRKITLVDPLTSKIVEISNKCFWKNKDCFTVVMSSKDLNRYKVIEIENDYKNISGKIKEKESTGKFKTVDCFITKEYSDEIHCKSHLGYILRDEDEVYGYDLGNCNLHFINRDSFKVLFVRKVYKNLKLFIKTSREHDREYQFFLEDILEDCELRKSVDVYHSTNKLIKDLETLKL